MRTRTEGLMKHRLVLALMFGLALLIGAPADMAAQDSKNDTKETPANSQASGEPQGKAVQLVQDSSAATPPVYGSGTANTIPVFTGSHTIHNSLITETGNGVTVNGTATATSFTGNGSSLTNVNAATLGGLGSGSFAQTGIGNTFTADQTIDGNLPDRSDRRHARSPRQPEEEPGRQGPRN
jgi:hypothetical protein